MIAPQIWQGAYIRHMKSIDSRTELDDLDLLSLPPISVHEKIYTAMEINAPCARIRSQALHSAAPCTEMRSRKEACELPTRVFSTLLLRGQRLLRRKEAIDGEPYKDALASCGCGTACVGTSGP